MMSQEMQIFLTVIIGVAIGIVVAKIAIWHHFRKK